MHKKDGILYVATIGKVHFIVKLYRQWCHCNFHIDTYFFNDFHHVSRWRLIFYKMIDKHSGKTFHLAIPKYIWHKEEDGIITEKITITKYDPSCLQKNLNNRLNLNPPSLFQQALHAVMRMYTPYPSYYHEYNY